MFINFILKLDTINNTSVKLDNNFKVKKLKTVLLDNDVFRSYFIGDYDKGWKVFRKKHPRSLGYMTLSKIAYSEDNQLMMIYVDLKYGGLGAVGYILMIDLNSYNIVKKELLWES